MENSVSILFYLKIRHDEQEMPIKTVVAQRTKKPEVNAYTGHF